MAASLLGRTGSRINRQELIAKASSYSGISTLRSLLNDSTPKGFFHYLWLSDSCSDNKNECNVLDLNPAKKYWSDDEWCKGSSNCEGRQKAPMCITSEEIPWDEILTKYGILFDNLPDSVGVSKADSKQTINQSFNFISTKYIGTEKYGVSSILLEGMATSSELNTKTASNKLRVNIQVSSNTNEEGFGFLSIGENQLDGEDITNGQSLFLGNLAITPFNNAKGSIIWRRNIKDNNECVDFVEQAKGSYSSLPSNDNGGLWVQPLNLPKQPRLSRVEDIGILICTSKVIQKEDTKCKINPVNSSEKVYRIHSLYVKGPGSKFEISTKDNAKIILEIMGDIDISNGGIFCHKDGLNSCGSGKPENLTILFKQKTTSLGNQISCDNSDNSNGGVKLKKSVDFINHQYPIDNNQLPGSSFLIDSTGITSNDKFSAFLYGPKVTFLSVRPESPWVQIPNSRSESNNNGLIVTTRSSYGWIKNTLGRSFEDKMVNIILSPDSNLIPYLGTKELAQANEDETSEMEIVGIGYKVNPLPFGSSLDSNADKVFLVYNTKNKSYFLRTFDVENTNPESQSSSEYSYPRAFAKMHSENIKTNVNLPYDLNSQNAKEWLDAFDINVEKLNLQNARNFSGAAWVKNLCFDDKGEKNWEFSNNFIDKLREWHGDDFNWGVPYYRGRSILLWDTLRDFKS